MSAWAGDSKAEDTPGRDSLAQSNFLLQKLHWTLQRGATGR
jgi:hypothetical protein